MILETAARHFSLRGYEAASLEEIASEVGVTKPAIYYHFKGKSALYESVLLSRLEELAESLRGRVADKSGAKERLRAYIEGFGSFLERNDCLAAILLHEFADNGEHMSDAAAGALASTLEILSAIVETGVEEGTFVPMNPMVVQMGIVAPLITHQTTRRLRQRVTARLRERFRYPPEPDIEDFSKILAANILKTLRKEPS